MNKKTTSQVLSKGKAEDAEETDRQEMYALFHQAENEYDLKASLFEELHSWGEEGTIPDLKRLFAKLWSKIEETNTSRRIKVFSFNSILKYAAILVIGLIAGYMLTLTSPRTEPVYYSAHSPRGSVSEMVLPDGSVIFLNSDSRIKYSIEGANKIREVFLDGEAWFQVEKNKKKPFVVHTPVYDVYVTGTRFNVKAYNTDSDITTTLEEGEVKIDPAGHFSTSESITLKPGEQAALNIESKNIAVKTVNTKWFTSWKDNKLIFVNMRLNELIIVLERKYGVEIEVKNKSILDYHYDGTIKNETILEILEIIKKTLPINYKIVGQKIEITTK